MTRIEYPYIEYQRCIGFYSARMAASFYTKVTAMEFYAIKQENGIYLMDSNRMNTICIMFKLKGFCMMLLISNVS